MLNQENLFPSLTLFARLFRFLNGILVNLCGHPWGHACDLLVRHQPFLAALCDRLVILACARVIIDGLIAHFPVVPS